MSVRKTKQLASYAVTTAKSEYIVTLERIKNDVNGNGRYKATIIDIGSRTRHDYLTTVYTFTGHYRNDFDECIYIVCEHEMKEEKSK